MLKKVSFNHNSSFKYHSFVFSSQPIICTNAYRPPHYSTVYKSELSQLQSIIPTTYNTILISGDVNIHLGRQLWLSQDNSYSFYIAWILISTYTVCILTLSALAGSPGENSEETLSYFWSVCKLYRGFKMHTCWNFTRALQFFLLRILTANLNPLLTLLLHS